MRRSRVVLIGIVLALVVPAGVGLRAEQPPRAPSLAGAEAGTVVEALVTRAVDGHALDANVEGRRTLVGYLGVEAPAPNELCGQDALERNRELAGSRLALEEDPDFRFDDRGRRLYYAYTLDGISIDETLVREGLARATRIDARYGAYLAALQAEVEDGRRGCLWDERSP